MAHPFVVYVNNEASPNDARVSLTREVRIHLINEVGLVCFRPLGKEYSCQYDIFVGLENTYHEIGLHSKYINEVGLTL